MNSIITAFRHTLMITGFVGIMMVVIEYVNIVTQGRWKERIAHRRWGQYFLASLLGVIPGCLGAFAVVAMYTHRSLSIGAVVAAMIATAGDSSFVMFAMMPKTALLIHVILFPLGIIAGALTDALLGRRLTAQLSCETSFVIHEEERCDCFPWGKLLTQWKHCTPTRGTLTLTLTLFLLAVIFGEVGPSEWNWVRSSLVGVSAVALFIVSTVPDHFLEAHLWHHVVRGHVPRIFLWTLCTMLVLHLVVEQWQMANVIQNNEWVVLGVSGLVGLIPESGPHIFFVTMFSKELIPFSTLLASSIVQDGHGMLPLLAHSRKAFIVIKLINLLIGLAVGALIMLIKPLI